MRRNFVRFVLLTCGLATPLAAADAGATFAVSAIVLPSCTMSSGAVAFDGYAPRTASSREGAVTVSCSRGTPYAIALDEGAAGNGTSRRMMRPDGATIPYDLYRDGAHLQRWADGASAQPGTGSGAAQAHTLYAAIPPNAASPGNYSDNVVILVSY